MKKIDFLKCAVKDYRVGAVTASSKYVVRRIIREIKPEYKYIVEYGAGEGVITKEILKRLPADGALVGIELNKNFIIELTKINDKRLRILNENVLTQCHNLKLLELPQIDAVISGIPFSFLKPSQRKEVIKNTCESLADGGMFLAYQISPLILPLMKGYFPKVSVQIEPRNIPPYFIMKATK